VRHQSKDYLMHYFWQIWFKIRFDFMSSTRVISDRHEPQLNSPFNFNLLTREQYMINIRGVVLECSPCAGRDAGFRSAPARSSYTVLTKRASAWSREDEPEIQSLVFTSYYVIDSGYKTALCNTDNEKAWHLGILASSCVAQNHNKAVDWPPARSWFCTLKVGNDK
jgi:hypothetical protein